MSLRIIAGKFKGRILKTPTGSSTRPTQSMVREAVFNICQNIIVEARFLDVFAGSGAMGIEALSRGATHATLIEKDRNAANVIRANIACVEIESSTTLLVCDAHRAIERLSIPFDIVYIDPPYDTQTAPIVKELLAKKLLCPGGTLFIEERNRTKTMPPEFEGLTLVGSRRFGEAVLHQYTQSNK